ncbi:MAG: hypothetical protein WCG48_00600 [Candidatus Berkelbacteria bacterium]
MSKKKHNKFKKKQQAITVKETTQPEAISSGDELIMSKTITKELAVEAENEIVNGHDYSYVKKDLKKIGIVLAILVILFVSFYILGIKTNLLNAFGDWIYKILHINIS